jgi:hypothetical protein
MDQPPKKRGRGAARLDEPEDDRPFGQDRLKPQDPKHRRSTKDAAFASSLSRDRGTALNRKLAMSESYELYTDSRF